MLFKNMYSVTNQNERARQEKYAKNVQGKCKGSNVFI